MGCFFASFFFLFLFSLSSTKVFLPPRSYRSVLKTSYGAKFIVLTQLADEFVWLEVNGSYVDYSREEGGRLMACDSSKD